MNTSTSTMIVLVLLAQQVRSQESGVRSPQESGGVSQESGVNTIPALGGSCLILILILIP